MSPREQADLHPRPVVLLALVLGVVALAYLQAPAAGFVWDDHELIEEHPLVRELHPPGAYFGRMFWADPLKGGAHSYYRPLTTLSYAIDYRLGGGGPTLFHLTNLALHLAVCALVSLLARRGGAPPVPAALAATLFGTFPRLTEAVTWISGRTDLLASVFALSALLLHRTEPERRGRRIAAAGCLLLGLLCKEVAAAGAIVLVGLELSTSRRPLGRRLLGLVPLLIALVAYAALRAGATGASPDQLQVPPWQRPILALQALGTYTLMLLDPLRPRLQIGTLGVVEPLMVGLGALVAVGLVALGIVAWRRRWRGPVVGAVLALTALLPVLHLVPLPINVVAADRYLYLPLAGLAVALAVAASRLEGRAALVLGGVGACAALAFAGATWLRNLDWADELRLWQAAVETAPPDNGLAYGGLGDVLLDRERPADALPMFERALRIDAEAARTHNWSGVRNLGVSRGNIARCLEKLGRFEEALTIQRGLVAASPGSVTPRLGLAMTLARSGAFARAEAELREVARAFPDQEAPARVLAQVIRARERWTALPPERPDEPLEVTAERAELLDELGGSFEAARRWERVGTSEGVRPELLRRAAGYLAFKGRPEVARRLLERLARQADAGDEVAVLESVLAERFGPAR